MAARAVVGTDLSRTGATEYTLCAYGAPAVHIRASVALVALCAGAGARPGRAGGSKVHG